MEDDVVLDDVVVLDVDRPLDALPDEASMTLLLTPTEDAPDEDDTVITDEDCTCDEDEDEDEDEDPPELDEVVAA